MDAAELERRMAWLENSLMPRREIGLELHAREQAEADLDRRIHRLEDSQKWAFRMVAAGFVGFLFQAIIILYIASNNG